MKLKTLIDQQVWQKLKVIKKRRALMNKIIKERKEIITETTRTNNLISLWIICPQAERNE